MDFGFLSLFDVIVVHLGLFACCLFCTRLGNDRDDGNDFGVVLE